MGREGKREKVDEIKKHLASHCSTCKREKEREGDRPLDICSRCRLACYLQYGVSERALGIPQGDLQDDQGGPVKIQ